MKKLMYANDLVVLEEKGQKRQGRVSGWNSVFGELRRRMNKVKTEVMAIGKKHKTLKVRVEAYEVRTKTNE